MQKYGAPVLYPGPNGQSGVNDIDTHLETSNCVLPVTNCPSSPDYEQLQQHMEENMNRCGFLPPPTPGQPTCVPNLESSDPSYMCLGVENDIPYCYGDTTTCKTYDTYDQCTPNCGLQAQNGPKKQGSASRTLTPTDENDRCMPYGCSNPAILGHNVGEKPGECVGGCDECKYPYLPFNCKEGNKGCDCLTVDGEQEYNFASCTYGTSQGREDMGCSSVRHVQ